MAVEQKQFNVTEVPLQGTNLVEASAGTGKTYSIAIIALRLLLEKDISLSEILMVTYTKAAVAELEQRIRIFIKKAAAVADGELIDDATITKYVEESILVQGRESIKAKLDAARIFIDETSILTIHSFCQLVLQEFSFETGALFGMNLVTSISDIITQEVQIFWRSHISGLPLGIFPYIEGIDIETLTQTVSMQLGGRKYAGFEEGKKYEVNQEKINEVELELKTLEQAKSILVDRQLAILSNEEDISARIQTNTYARKAMTDLLGDTKALLAAILYKPETQYKQKLFPDFLDIQTEVEAAELLITNASKKIQHSLTCMALQHIIPAVQVAKRNINVLGFDDLIIEVHNALVANSNQPLIEKLQNKYKAVFLDEFQDTDLKQYEIFKTAFAGTSIIFYIGDPKQSIYKFRSADIFTYLQAKKEVDFIYTMNTNYRSSTQYIQAANQFLKPTEDFDTFFFATSSDGIDYINVEAASDKQQQLISEKKPIPALVLASAKNKTENLNAIVSCAAMLLNGKHFLTVNRNPRPVQPSDIGILVSKNKVAKSLSVALSSRNIPSVLVSDAKIFDSIELQFIFYVLSAILEPSVNNINKALLSKFTGIDETNIHLLNYDLLLPAFNLLSDKWTTQGVYSTVKDFFQQFNVESSLITAQSTIADRSITNLQQVIEILYKAERINNLQPKELLLWLQRIVEEKGEGDEYLQRIESEEDAIKISTVHKSKGLEYNIVIAPNLDYTLDIYSDFVQYRDPTSKLYVSKHIDWMSEEEMNIYLAETEQEHRRLLYVALTRAVYCSIIIQSTANYYNKSTLSSFVNAIEDKSPYSIDQEYFDNTETYHPKTETKKFTPNPISLPVSDSNWYKLSYSSVAAEVSSLPVKRKDISSVGYDKFIFKTLSLGAETGNLVHTLFEKISFTSDEFWEDSIAKVVMQYRPKDIEWLQQFKELATQVLGAAISTGGEKWSLSEINGREKIHELEFYFPLTNLDTTTITDLFATHGITTYLKSVYAASGMMQGFVDLLFFHKDKYYILDWKTTFLGNAVQDYNARAVAEAMTEHNYHLQYMIYCVAVSKYLASRKSDFDYDKDFGGVIYGFIRGMRIGDESGIFFTKPKKEFVEKLGEILGS